MSRSGYSDDYNYMDLYRATVANAIGGKRGQKFLKDLADSLDSMEDKKLITSELISQEGEVCAIGSVCKTRGLDVSRADVEDPASVGALVDISRSMAAEIEYENDEAGPNLETPEQRWIRMRQWVRDNLK